MDQVFAKVTDRNNHYRTLLSDVAIYSRPQDLANAKPYDPGYKPEDDEWFVLTDFSKTAYCLQVLKEPLDTTGFKMLNVIQPEKIEYICSYQDENEFYFQRIFKSSLMKQKRFLHIGDDIRFCEEKHGLVINDLPDALYLREEDLLYFRKLETIAPVFHGISDLYKEACEQDVRDFLESPFIRLGDTYHTGRVGVANRRRITVAREVLKNLSAAERDDMFRYTDEYYPDLKYDGTSFLLNNENDLKMLMFGISQRFYTTRITHEKRVANSVSRLDP